jgi:hypothetical protein
LIEEVGRENKDIVLEDKEFARTIDWSRLNFFAERKKFSENKVEYWEGSQEKNWTKYQPGQSVLIQQDTMMKPKAKKSA